MHKKITNYFKILIARSLLENSWEKPLYEFNGMWVCPFSQLTEKKLGCPAI